MRDWVWWIQHQLPSRLSATLAESLRSCDRQRISHLRHLFPRRLTNCGGCHCPIAVASSVAVIVTWEQEWQCRVAITTRSQGCRHLRSQRRCHRFGGV